MTNYTALGEYTAYSEQARDAAGRRFAYMKNLANQLNRMAEQPDMVVQEEALQWPLLTSSPAKTRCAQRWKRRTPLLRFVINLLLRRILFPASDLSPRRRGVLNSPSSTHHTRPFTLSTQTTRHLKG